MEKSRWETKQIWPVSIFLLLWIASQAILLVHGCANTTEKGFQHNNSQKLVSSSPLRLYIMDRYVVMDNGHLKVTLTNPEGMVSEIQYNGVDNLLEFRQKEGNRGYWDMVWSRTGKKGQFDMIHGTSFEVITQNEHQIEISFKKTYDPSHDDGTNSPLNVDKRYIMQRGQSGFYTYAIFERLEGWPAMSISETRIAFKLGGDRFEYMAVSDSRQRVMPSAHDRSAGKTLDYREAVLLTNPANPSLKGEVDDKYQYSKENKDNHLHGWISTNPQVGFWVVMPSYEYRTGGPVKQELTSHVGPTSLATFYSRHYAGEVLKGLSFEDGEAWKKVFGPVLIYLNSNSNDDVHATRAALWDDAKQQMETEKQKWPYNFPKSKDFPHADERGTVTGHLNIRDRYINREVFPAKYAYVGLALPGDPGSWQLDAKGYQFWNLTDNHGHFTIRDVRPGRYSLYAWAPGIFGDYKYDVDVNIKPGSQSNLGDLEFNPPRNGPTLWEIGIPDRSAAEFNVPDADPGLTNRLYMNKQKFRQYGLWDRYTDLYPNQDLVYKVGSSNYQKDWFFAHVTRKTANNTYEPTTWQISFDLRNVNPWGVYTLRVALASAAYAELQVRVNNPNSVRPLFTTRLIGRDNAIARHGIHGLYWSYALYIPGYRLLYGSNTIYLKQSRASNKFSGLMYDYIRLEGPQ